MITTTREAPVICNNKNDTGGQHAVAKQARFTEDDAPSEISAATESKSTTTATWRALNTLIMVSARKVLKD